MGYAFFFFIQPSALHHFSVDASSLLPFMNIEKLVVDKQNHHFPFARFVVAVHSFVYLYIVSHVL